MSREHGCEWKPQDVLADAVQGTSRVHGILWHRTYDDTRANWHASGSKEEEAPQKNDECIWIEAAWKGQREASRQSAKYTA